MKPTQHHADKTPATPHLVRDVSLRTPDGQWQMVVEIHAGERAKFETDPVTGFLFHEHKNGKPRYVRYLGYPVPYGFLPQTLGAENDQVDALLMGDGPPCRGEVIKGRIIGALKKFHGRFLNPKILLVPDYGPFAHIEDIQELPAGVLTILLTWFKHYAKGVYGRIAGTMSRREAEAWVWQAHQRWRRSARKVDTIT